MTQTENTDLAFWQRRLEAVGRAQGRYLFLLALAGLFYYALEIHVTDLGATPGSLELPVVSVEVSALTVWASGPITLGFLLLAVLGACHAVETAATQSKRAAGLETSSGGLPEHFDVSFNIVDAVVYTTDESPAILKRGLSLTYPAILTLFWVEAAVFLVVSFAFSSADLFPQQRFAGWSEVSASVFRGLGLIAVALPIPRLLSLWRSKLGVRGGSKSSAA